MSYSVCFFTSVSTFVHYNTANRSKASFSSCQCEFFEANPGLCVRAVTHTKACRFKPLIHVIFFFFFFQVQKNVTLFPSWPTLTFPHHFGTSSKASPRPWWTTLIVSHLSSNTHTRIIAPVITHTNLEMPVFICSGVLNMMERPCIITCNKHVIKLSVLHKLPYFLLEF